MQNEKSLTKNDWLRIFIFWGFLVFLTFIFRNNPFFWDNILLSSKYAHHFLENGYATLLVDAEIDSGHPTFFGIYLSLVWRIFGYSLPVAHFSMLPFLFLLSFYFYKIQKYFVGQSLLFLSIIFFICEPSLMAQCTMVSPEILVIGGMLMGISGLLYNKRLNIVLATLLMTSVSTRGAIMVFLLYLIGIAVYKIRDNKFDYLLILYFIPSFLLFLAWNYFHYIDTGWYIAGGNPKWADQYQIVGFTDVLKNIISIVRNLLDFGRIFLWMSIFGIAIIYHKKSKVLCSKKLKILIVIMLISLILFTLIFVFNANPIGHRYMLLWYVFGIILLLMISKGIVPSKLKKATLFVIALFVCSGNFWIYPEKIAQGWDSTMGHLAFFQLREDALEYIDKEGVASQNRVGAGFILRANSKFVDLNERNFVINDKNNGLENFEYILYSNVNNDFTDQEIEELNSKWILEKEFCNRSLCIKLFRRNNFI